MDFQPGNRDDIVLPSWIGKVFALFVFVVAFGLIYYGVHDGIIEQDIAYRTKSGQASIGKGYVAVGMGLMFLGLGIALARASVLIYKSTKK